MELKCLLMWLLFGSIKANKPEKCPALPRTKFADVTAETYPVGTKLYYECDRGYTRRGGQYPGIRCQSIQQVASWVYKKFECIDEKILLSMAPTMELDFTQKPERMTQSPAPQKQENLSEFDQKDFCGPPKTIPHASLSLNKQYYVGQVLHFKCQSGYDKRSPISGTRTCKKVNGKIIWTPLDMQCTNDSSYSDEWPPQVIEPDPSVSLWCPVQSVPVLAPASGTKRFIERPLLQDLFLKPAHIGYWLEFRASYSGFDSSILFLICDTASDREDFSGNCSLQIQTHEIDTLPQKKPDCTSDSKTSSCKQGESLDTQIQSMKEAEDIMV